MRFASRCQPGRAFCGHERGAWYSATRRGNDASPHPTASSTSAAARTPSGFTRPLKPVYGDPGPRAAVTFRDVVDAARPRPELVVEAHFAGIAVARGTHPVGDRARDHHEPNAAAPQDVDVAVR